LQSQANGQPLDLVELKEAFDRLPAGQRATAVLRLYVGLSEQETGRKRAAAGDRRVRRLLDRAVAS
jgi:hypothetical protein